MGKLFSVIVPVYNIEDYIEECVESILKQVYPNWELILVDDGSTDGSSMICRRYSAMDDRIIYLNKENSGQSDARNMGVSKARGDYLVFVDGDDFISKNALNDLNEECLALENVDVILSTAMSELVQGTREISIGNMLDKDEYRKLTGHDVLVKGLDNNFTWSPCGKAYRKDFWEERGFFFPTGRISEDFTLIPKVVFYANTVGCVDNFYTYRRFRNGSSASYNVKKMVLDDISAFDEWETFFKQEDIDKILVDKFRRRFLRLFCHNSMAYLYLFDGEDRKRMLDNLKRYRYLFRYANDAEEIVISKAVSLIGMRATCYLLGIIKRKRLKKILVGI